MRNPMSLMEFKDQEGIAAGVFISPAFPAMGLLESSERGGIRGFDRHSSEARFLGSVTNAAYLEICLLNPLLRLFSPRRQLHHRCQPFLKLRTSMPPLARFSHRASAKSHCLLSDRLQTPSSLAESSNH